jgi:REP element-mobilizing transposase RayT
MAGILANSATIVAEVAKLRAWVKNLRPAALDEELYARTGKPCHFTICAYRKQKPFVIVDLNDAIVDLLHTERERLGCYVHVYCLMPDHLHLLCSPCEDGNSMLTFVDQFKGKSTRESWLHGCQGKLWQPRSYDHLVREEEDLLEITNYILHNPVRKGLAKKPEDYPWCGVIDSLPL